jgi:hypothetical protein
MNGAAYLLLGIVLAIAAFVLLMPFFRPRHRGGFYPPASYWGPYWYHGGGPYRPGLLY